MESAATIGVKPPSFFWRLCAPGIGLFLAWLIVCAIAGMQANSNGLAQYALPISVATGAAFMVVAFILVRSFTQRMELNWSFVKREWLIGTAGVVAIYSTTFMINQMLGLPREDLMQNLFVSQTAPGVIALLLAIVVAAPIGEEIALRYFLLGAFTFKPTPAWERIAIVLTASIFMLIHVPQYEYLTTHITILGVGLLMGYMRVRSGGLLLPMILHAQAGATALIFNTLY